ncbi:MAG: cation transporter [Nitrospinae bacterium]|nr:cation transporter [Nitrospinota bacterium]
MGHTHHHKHTEAENIRLAFGLNLIFAFVEALGGFYIGSMAVISNAIHDMGDSVALGLSWYFSTVSEKERNRVFSYGYRRFSLLSALFSGIFLFFGSVIILYNAIPRVLNPTEANPGGMLVFAIIGLLVNGLAAFRLKGGHTMNERMMMLHLMEDVLGWAAVFLAGIVMYFLKVPQLDPILAILITIFILYNAYKNLKTTMAIFMQVVPSSINIGEIEKSVLALDGVKGLHDLHIWSLDGVHHIASLHIVVEKPLDVIETLEIKTRVREITSKYSINHATIEVEFGEKDCLVHGSTHCSDFAGVE